MNEQLPQIYFSGQFSGASDVAFHSHECDELVLVKDGSCFVEMSEQRLAGHLGTLYVVPRECEHNQINGGSVNTTYIGFIADNTDFSVTPRTVQLEISGVEFRWLQDIHTLRMEWDESMQLTLQSLMLALLLRLNRLEQRDVKAKEVHPGLRQVLELFKADLCAAYSVEELAAITHFSPSYLTALFKRQFGCGPLRYQQNLRLQQAITLLSNPYLSVNEVAAQVGYVDSNYFARLFRQRYGQSPTCWRNKSQWAGQ